MAPQQNAARQRCRATLVGDGGCTTLVRQSGMPGGGAARGGFPAQSAWGLLTSPTYCLQTTQALAFSQLPPRRLSCVVRGKLELLAMLLLSQPFPVGILQAEVWPETMTAPQKQKASVVSKKKTHKEKERRKKQKRRARECSRAPA